MTWQRQNPQLLLFHARVFAGWYSVRFSRVHGAWLCHFSVPADYLLQEITPSTFDTMEAAQAFCADHWRQTLTTALNTIQ